MPDKERYSIRRVDTDEPVPAEPDHTRELQENEAAVAAKTGGLPIVAFVLFCLAAFLPTAFGRFAALWAAGSIGLALFCGVMIAILLLGIAALVYGTLRVRRGKSTGWLALRLVVLAAALSIGFAVGLLAV